jgi:glycosyltransferase involved in cell wall biosynthesis
VLVLPSHAETYGMVVTEALARGLPVITTAVGGLPEALGRTSDGRQPGLLVPAGDSGALAAALRCWLGDAELRQGLRAAARERRSTLTGWDVTSSRVTRVLSEAAS